jgi:flagellar hook-length control protein FliK
MTDRTQPARSTALTTRPAAAPAERRDDSAFAALLDAHATPTRREDTPVRRDDRTAPRRDDRPAHNEVRDARRPARETSPAEAAGPREAARRDLIAAGAAVADQDLHLSPEAPPATLIAPVLPAGEPAVAPAVTPALVAPELPVVPAAVAPAVQEPALPAPAAEAAPVIAAQPGQLPVAAAPATTPDQVLADTAATQAAAAPQAGTTPAKPATPETAATRVPAEQAGQAPTAEPTAAQAEEPSAPAPAQPAAAPAAQAKAEPQAAAPAAPATPVDAAPDVQTSAPLTGSPAAHRAAPLHRAPAAVATLLHVAVERGITRAKMALRPAELGGIEIRLQTTAAGVAAQVVADSPEAAKLLAQASDDLRRALEARDVTLLSLEVSTSGDQKQQSARGEWSDGSDNDFFGPSGRPGGDAAEGDAEPAPTTVSTIELPGGLLVDVLA